MDRTNQDRDEETVPENFRCSTPPHIDVQESSLPPPSLASALPFPIGGRANASAFSRAVFSPTQTLDQLHRQLTPPPPTFPPDLDPSGASNFNSPAPPRQQAAEGSAASRNHVSVRYRECLRNHAAGMGNHVVDGCGEFMPGGEDGTAEAAVRCAACGCHRSFHRREVEGETHQYPKFYLHKNPAVHSGQLYPSAAMETAYHYHHHHQHAHNSPRFAASSATMVSFGRNSGGLAAAESSSEDFSMFQSTSPGGNALMHPAASCTSNKRFRTKFNQEQKDKMHEFATKLGWRIRKEDEEEVQQFCNETGVKRQVFKVWMHNNKQAMKKRQT